jgi:hypothetical protein
MATNYPREDGRPLPDWAELPSATREHLAGQTPHRLKTLMYPQATDWDAIPPDDFTTHADAADGRLRDLLASEPAARAYFGAWTFAKVAHEPDPMRAAEAEYHLCDALIEYASQHHDGVWNPAFTVLDPTLFDHYRA